MDLTPEQMAALIRWVDAKIELAMDKGGAEEMLEMNTREDLLSAFGLMEDRYANIVKIGD